MFIDTSLSHYISSALRLTPVVTKIVAISAHEFTHLDLHFAVEKQRFILIRSNYDILLAWTHIFLLAIYSQRIIYRSLASTRCISYG